MPDKKLDIYPPEIFDPLLPGGIPSKPDGGVDPAKPGAEATVFRPAPDPDAVARDRYLGELAKDYNPDEDPQR